MRKPRVSEYVQVPGLSLRAFYRPLEEWDGCIPDTNSNPERTSNRTMRPEWPALFLFPHLKIKNNYKQNAWFNRKTVTKGIEGAISHYFFGDSVLQF